MFSPPVLLLLVVVISPLAAQNYYFPQYPPPAGTTPFVLPQDDTCVVRKEWSHDQKCMYIKENADNCEGGGYLMWSRYVVCTRSMVAKVFILIAAVICLLVLFLHISTTADEFFSPNIAAIVAHLKISESLAGVTFMAFGNGAPDIFGSIASILSTPRPKANLALGSLLGGGLFVTTCVLGTIILKSGGFRVQKFGAIRDLLFYLIAVGWILFVFLSGDTVLLYEPLVYLGLYVIYVIVVIGGTMLLNRYKRRRITDGSSSKRSRSRRSRHSTKRSISSRRHSSRAHSIKRAASLSIDPQAEVYIITDNVEKDKSSLKFVDDVENGDEHTDSASYMDEEEDEGEAEDVVVLHHHVYDREDAPFGEEDGIPPTFTKSWKWSDIPKDLAIHLNPWPSTEDWEESGKIGRIAYILRVPSQIILRATVPRYEDGWSKPVALFYVLVAPQFVLFAIHYLTTSPFHGSPGLYVYGFAVSAIFIVLLLFFTRMDEPPRYHKEFACYLGFILAVAWIYFTASEIVNIITMIGVVTGLSAEILGLTILAWSNCIGDFIADLAVVKQGFPRMAMAAATGGPLFNLLMGFGLSFTIAKAKGSVVEIDFSSALHFVVIFLFVSLATTLIAILAQRFFVTRYHAFALYLVYAAFFILVVLCEAKVIVWN